MAAQTRFTELEEEYRAYKTRWHKSNMGQLKTALGEREAQLASRDAQLEEAREAGRKLKAQLVRCLEEVARLRREREREAEERLQLERADVLRLRAQFLARTQEVGLRRDAAELDDIRRELRAMMDGAVPTHAAATATAAPTYSHQRQTGGGMGMGGSGGGVDMDFGDALTAALREEDVGISRPTQTLAAMASLGPVGAAPSSSVPASTSTGASVGVGASAGVGAGTSPASTIPVSTPEATAADLERQRRERADLLACGVGADHPIIRRLDQEIARVEAALHA